MVKRILSKGGVILGLCLATSLVAAYQHHQTNAEQKSSVTMSASRRQLTEYLDYNVEITPTPKPEIIGEREVVSIYTIKHELKSKRSNMKQEEIIYKYDVTKAEREILERIVEAEATDQSIDSKKNVGSVIMNRVESNSFPDNIEDVVFQKRQFSPIEDKRYYKVDITQDTKDAVEEVLLNGVTNEALYFCNPDDVKSAKNKRWFSKLKYLFTDDANHSFYTE
jgi:N-acetylmuramoyl-L-alanine amidase